MGAGWAPGTQIEGKRMGKGGMGKGQKMEKGCGLTPRFTYNLSAATGHGQHLLTRDPPWPIKFYMATHRSSLTHCQVLCRWDRINILFAWLPWLSTVTELFMQMMLSQRPTRTCCALWRSVSQVDIARGLMWQLTSACFSRGGDHHLCK